MRKRPIEQDTPEPALASPAEVLPAAPVVVAAYLTERAETARTSTVHHPELSQSERLTGVREIRCAAARAGPHPIRQETADGRNHCAAGRTTA